jgi:predicted aspartyl protease
LRKRTKKLLPQLSRDSGTNRASTDKSFLLLFCKKEVLALSFLLSACATQPQDPCRLAYAGQAPLWHIANRLVIPVTINAHLVPMLFDTGGAVSILPSQLVTPLGLQPLAKPPQTTPQLAGLGGTRTAQVKIAGAVTIGQLYAANIPFLVPDDTALRLTSRFPPTVGMNFLNGFDMDLDFAENRLVLFKPVGACIVPHVLLTPPLYYAVRVLDRMENRPVVLATIQGQTFRTLLDTGAPQSLLFQDAATRLGLSPETLAADPHQLLTGIGPAQVRTARHRTDSIIIGGLKIGGLPLNVSPETDPRVDLVLGMDILSRVHLWISNSSHEVILQYPPQRSPSPRPAS